MIKRLVIGLTILVGFNVEAATVEELKSRPLFSIEALQYIGGFRVPRGENGVSSIAYSQGPITLGANGESLYVTGSVRDQSVAEITIPALVNSMNIENMNTASWVQPFSLALERAQTGNPQNVDRIGGMELVDGRLLVNGYEYYDADVSVSHTTLVMSNAANLGGSTVHGFYSLQGGAHASQWISPIPQEWQSHLGGTHLAGSSSELAIATRSTIGPSAFAFNPVGSGMGTASPGSISTVALQDFDMDHPLGSYEREIEVYRDYMYNTDRTNKLWTYLSTVGYGFIVPGTRTFLTIGSNGGLESGIGYKITQNNGDVCGGPCAYDAEDYYNYYWLWDMNDWLEVRNGTRQPHEIMPYAHGKFVDGYPQTGFDRIYGGTYDYSRGILYLALSRGDYTGGAPYPLIVAFQIDTVAPANPPSNVTAREIEN